MRTLNQKILTEMQEYITEYQREHGLSPSYRSIKQYLNMSSLNLVQRYVLELEKKGRIERTDIGNIKTPFKWERKGTTMALLVGDIACGDPTAEEENIEANIALPNAIFGSGQLFMLRAKGDSMINAGIEEGDLLVVRKQNTADDGEIVVALTDGRNTLKKIYHKNGKIILHPENPKLKDIIANDCEVQGVLVSCIKMYG